MDLTYAIVSAGPEAGASRRTGWAWCWRLALIVALCLGLGSVAQAEDEVRLVRATFYANHADRLIDPGTYLDAQFAFTLPGSLREAVEHGVALYFVTDLDVSRSRWYWFDKHLVTQTVQTRLSYSPLTRQYRLTRGGLAQPFDTLDQALATLQKIVQWRIADLHALDGGGLQARLRMRLDTSMLPKPFQISAMTDHDWKLDSDWLTLAVKLDPPAN